MSQLRFVSFVANKTYTIVQ